MTGFCLLPVEVTCPTRFSPWVLGSLGGWCWARARGHSACCVVAPCRGGEEPRGQPGLGHLGVPEVRSQLLAGHRQAKPCLAAGSPGGCARRGCGPALPCR